METILVIEDDDTLRKKVESDPRHPVHIHTVREFGYRFTIESE